MDRDNAKIDYMVFAMYGRKGACSFLSVLSKNLGDAIREAREFRCLNILLMDQFGNQYVIRVNGVEYSVHRKGQCVTKGNRSCAGCYFKSSWGNGCLH